MNIRNHKNICLLSVSLLAIMSVAIITLSQMMVKSSLSSTMNRSGNSIGNVTPSQNDHITPIANGIKVGDHPRAIAINPFTNTIYVGNLFSKSVSIINGQTNKVVANIAGIDYPDDAAVDPSINMVYVTSRYAHEVSVINGQTNKVVAKVMLDISPIEIAVDSSLHRVYVADMDNETISVINGQTNKVVAKVMLGISRGGIALGDIAVNPTTHMIYVINYGNILRSDDVHISVINGQTNKVVANITDVAQSPSHIVINPDTNTIYINNVDANRLSIINGHTNRLENTIILDRRPPKQSPSSSTLDINPSANTIYMTNSGYNDIAIINTLANKVEKTVTVNGSPVGVAVNPTANKVYITNEDSKSVSEIDGKTHTLLLGPHGGNLSRQNLYNNVIPKGFKVASGPSSIAVNPSTNKIYVGYGISNKISVFDVNNFHLIKNIAVEAGMKKIAVNPSTNKIYVANQDAKDISVIDGDSDNLMVNIPIRGGPFDISIDPFGNIYVTSRELNILSVIDSTTDRIISTVAIYSNSSSLSVNQLTHKVYVANQGVVVDRNENAVYPVTERGSNIVIVIDKVFDYKKSMNEYKIISNIPVENPPSDIAVNPNTNMIYVAGNGQVSFIDGYTNHVTASIRDFELGLNLPLTVNPSTDIIYLVRGYGEVSAINASSNRIVSNFTSGYNNGEGAIAVNPKTNMVYVTNEQFNSVSVVNASSNNLIVGITFNADPTNAGHIICNTKEVPNNIYIILDVYSKCRAVHNTGFVFSSWSGRLSSNFVNTSGTVVNASDYGSLTANFRQEQPELNVTIPNDLLYGVILGPIVGSFSAWLIPFFWDRRNKRAEIRAVRTHIPIIDRIYESSKQNQVECLTTLAQKRSEVTKLLEEGKINDSTFQILNDRISQYLDELRDREPVTS
jgi:YVTN family beta-propeller protein